MKKTIHPNYLKTAKFETFPEIFEELELIEKLLENHVQLSKQMFTWLKHFVEIYDIPLSAYNQSLEPYFTIKNNLNKEMWRKMELDILTENSILNSLSLDDIPLLVTELHIKLFFNVDKHSKEKYKAIILEDAIRHYEFLLESIKLDSQVVFNEYVLWANDLFNSLGISTQTFIRFLVTYRFVLNEKKMIEGISYIDSSIRLLTNKKTNTVSFKNSYLKNNKSKNYFKLLIDEKNEEAKLYILHLLKIGFDSKKIILEVLQPTQYEVGLYWQQSKINVAKEHYCTAITKEILSIICNEPIFKTKDKNKVVLSTCVCSEEHDLGIHFVTKFLELDGWKSFYLGANVPVKSILEAIKDTNCDLLALSTTLVKNLKSTREIIENVKVNFPNLKIIVGGRPFLIDETLSSKLKADGFAIDAEKAVELANYLVS